MVFGKIILLVSTLWAQQTTFVPIHDNLVFDEPVQILFDGLQTKVAYVVEKGGVVYRAQMNKDCETKEAFMDIQDRVYVKNSEEGLLSMAFHPNFKEDNRVFVWYTANKPRRTVLSSFLVNHIKRDTQEITPTVEPAVDIGSEIILLTVRQPWGNHNGGTVLFGPDNYLYVSIGDGGSGGDPHDNGQNTNTLLGTVIRIDVNNTDGDKKYSIPPDNPFVSTGKETHQEEIWAWGLRNVWRMSFDKETGFLWGGDVGQHEWEEINIINKGGNFGWNIREGKHPFDESVVPTTELVDPVYEYGRRSGGSITGGYVYRGKQIPELWGKYLFSDYMSGRTWALTKDGKVYSAERIAREPSLAISSYGESPDGEILVCGFKSPYFRKGRIYRLELSDTTISNTR